MTISLRDYQHDGVDKIRAEFKHTQRVIYRLSTGGGKTRLFSYICEATAAKGKRILIMAHRHQIVRQISATLREFGIPHGMILSGYTMTNHSVQVAMVQTAARRISRLAVPDLIITDEVHHAVCPQYKMIFAAFPNALSLGVTATPARTDGRGLREVFDVMVHGPEMRWLIDQKYLADFVYYRPPTMGDFSGIKRRAGELDAGQNAAAMDKPVITGCAIDHWFEHLPHQPTVVFCVNIKHAESVAADFQERGVRAFSIDGRMDTDTQDKLIKGLRSGDVEVLVSCQLVSEGVDIPEVSGIIDLARTLSLTKYMQDAGRALRPKKDGRHAIILDHVNNLDVHQGPPDMERAWSLDGCEKKTTIPTNRQCETCFWIGAPGQKPSCGFGAMCGLAGSAPGTTDRTPEQVDGQLIKYDGSWQKGWDLTAPGAYALTELELLAAGDPDKLKAIAKARGYHWMWTKHAQRRHVDRMRQAAI